MAADELVAKTIVDPNSARNQRRRSYFEAKACPTTPLLQMDPELCATGGQIRRRDGSAVLLNHRLHHV